MLETDLGVSRKDMVATMREVATTQQQRRQTNENEGKSTAFEESMERLRRKAAKVVGIRKSSKREIEILWEQAKSRD